ncbi:MAG: bifunctional serine/threonine-protein kinase/formylglycine-generating enzyme family protein [Gemmataceae bacterium]
MLLLGNLMGFGLRQILGADAVYTAENVVSAVEKHFADHSQTLPKALARANDRAWQALSIALAGDRFLDKIKVCFASGDDKGIREQVQLFLQDKNIGFEGTSADHRKQCLVELKTAKQAGLLTAQNLSPHDVARQTATFQRYADPKAMVDGAEQVMQQIADALTSAYPNLAKLLRQRPHGGPPLLVAAFVYFFRREVETNDELAHGLFFDGLRQLSASQAKAFGEVNKALISMGDQFERVFEQLDRIETVVVETQTVAVETHGAVLDMQVELQRLEGLHLANADEVRRLMQEVLHRVSQAGMHKGEVKPQHGFSIRSEDERTAVKQLLARFRQLTDQQQKQVPALLNGLGKLQFGSQDFDGARQTFVAVAEEVQDTAAQAEAQFNAYRAALEEKKWEDALAAIQKAALLDSQRFAPFPMQRYQPKQLLGAGGFGAAFLCHDRFFDAEVVVKTLHETTMERNMTDVFREAQVLRHLQHPAIIGVRDCNYADLTRMAHPYIVMDYFPGGTLATFIKQRGAISLEDMTVISRQIAEGMQAAHRQNILHRDLKPDNILVRKEGSTWKVKIIDFGLALRKQTIETSMAAGAAGNTILGDSVAGTIEYAPPEQMGKLKGVKPGPYSDVYAFGKMCCYALFKTTEPKNRHWATVSKDLHEMLEQCTEQELEHRLPNFEPVLKVLEALAPQRQKADAERKRREEEAAEQKRQELLQQQEAAHQKAEAERKRQEQEEAARQKRELEQLQQKGESKLVQFVREAMDRTQGKPSQEDSTAAREIVKQHRISSDRAKQIVAEVREQWQKANPPKPERKPGEIVTNSLGMKFAWIPSGTFLMGSPTNEPSRSSDESQHRVTLTKGFYMGVHLVTQEQWQAVMDNNPSYFKSEKNLPVDSVSWEGCQELIKKLRERDQKPYRLPTEAEWEYACRAGTTTPFSFGETISTDQANYDGNYIYGTGKKGVYRGKTTPVGIFPANAWGLCDMHGNVWEWCQDWYGPYPKKDINDPQSPKSGQYRVLRGGSWSYSPQDCRSAFRNWVEPGSRSSNFGLRVCFCLD